MGYPSDTDPVWRAVRALDLSTVVERAESGPPAMPRIIRSFGVRDYLHFLYLLAMNPGTTIVPTKMMDALWHAHILDTRKYAADCAMILASVSDREFIHHDPNIVRGTSRFDEGVRNRNELLDGVFGTPATPLDGDEDVSCDGETCA